MSLASISFEELCRRWAFIYEALRAAWGLQPGIETDLPDDEFLEDIANRLDRGQFDSDDAKTRAVLAELDRYFVEILRRRPADGDSKGN